MNMSRFVDNWRVGEVATYASLTCPPDKPVTLEIQISGAEPPERGQILIAQGISDSEELWAIRMIPSGRLVLQLGTAGHRETEEAHFPDLSLALSYHPTSGAISMGVGRAWIESLGFPWVEGLGELLTGHAVNQWVRHVAQHDRPPRESWQLRLGCPQDGRADTPPLGWKISAGFRFGEPAAPQPKERIVAPPISEAHLLDLSLLRRLDLPGGSSAWVEPETVGNIRPAGLPGTTILYFCPPSIPPMIVLGSPDAVYEALYGQPEVCA